MEAREERSLGELFGDLSRQLSDLIRQEIALARVETTERVGHVLRQGALIGLGGAIGYGGLLAVGAGVILWLVDAGLAGWVAASLVGIVALVVGLLLALAGRSGLRSVDLTPNQTIDQLKEDATWAKERMP